MKVGKIWSDGFERHWQWFKNYFSLNYLRYFGTWFAVAPVFAKLFDDSNKDICFDGSCLEYNFSLPFSWWLLWLGSLFFIIAFALYQFYCPKFIKDYSSYADYEAARHSPRWSAWEACYLVRDGQNSPCSYDLEKFVTRIHKKGFAIITPTVSVEPDVEVLETQSVLSFSYNGVGYELAMPKYLPEGVVDDKATYELVWEVFGRRASSYPLVRNIISFLIMLSWTTVVFVMIQNIISVARYLIG